MKQCSVMCGTPALCMSVKTLGPDGDMHLFFLLCYTANCSIPYNKIKNCSPQNHHSYHMLKDTVNLQDLVNNCACKSTGSTGTYLYGGMVTYAFRSTLCSMAWAGPFFTQAHSTSRPSSGKIKTHTYLESYF